MTTTQSMFVPLRHVLTSWPDSLFEAVSVLDRVGVKSATTERLTETSTRGSVTLGVETEATLGIPGLSGFEVAFGTDGAHVEFTGEATLSNDGFSIGVKALVLQIRVNSDLLQPMDKISATEFERSDDDYLAVTVTLGPTEGVTLDQDGKLTFGSDVTFDVPPFRLGDSGPIFEVTGFTVNLDRTSSSGFGIVLEELTLHPPEGMSVTLPSVTVQDLAIANGGLSGTVTADFNAGAVGGTLFGLSLSLESFSLSFEQNAITACDITGTLTLPWFDVDVNVTLSLGADGSWGVALSDADTDGLFTIEKDGLGILKLSSFALEIEDGEATVILGGSLTLTAGAPTLEWPEITIQELRIDSDGKVTIPGGWITLQEPASLNLYGFQMEISEIGFGKEDDGSRWVGLSGGVRLTEGLPSGASVDGLRVSFASDWSGEPDITLEGVGIELTIPGVLHIDGKVALTTDESTGDHIFAGDVALELESVGLSLDADLMIGHEATSDFNYLYVNLGVDLPVGIPLFASGTAIYGVSGLYGMNVKPTATDNDWYGWYSGSPSPFDMTDTAKWQDAQQEMAFGAGLTLGTLFDAGRVVSAKGLLVLLIPGPVVMVHAKANILSGRPELTGSEEGLFNALAVLDADEGYFQLNVDAQWELAKVLDIVAQAEAYFDFTNLTKWHFYLGEDDPEERRIRADVLALFSADSYFMVDARSIAQGFGVTIGDSWKFGPVKATLRAWIEAGAGITWQPPQLEGSLGLGGELGVSVAGFEVGIAAEADLSGETPTPYRVEGTLSVSVKLPWPVPDLDVEIELEWEKQEAPALSDPLTSVGLQHEKVAESWSPIVSASELDPTDTNPDDGKAIAASAPIVPLDARPVLTFARSVADNAGIDSPPPGGSTDEIGDYTLSYELSSLTLEKWPRAYGRAWVEVTEPPTGSWTAKTDADGNAAATELELNVRSSFSFTRNASRIYRDWLVAMNPTWPCGEDIPVVETCVDWQGARTGISLGPVFDADHLTFALDGTMTVARTAIIACDTGKALQIPGDQPIPVYVCFPEPTRSPRICVRAPYGYTVRAYANGDLVQTKTSGGGHAGFIVMEGNGIEWLVIEITRLRLAKVCYTLESDADAADYQIERKERIRSALESWNSEEPIFEPETYYRLKIDTKATREREGDEADSEYTTYAYFQTAGPPALTPGWALPVDSTDSEAYPEGGHLTDLSGYVRWTIPEDGAAAVYTSYDLGVDFNEDYVEQMFGADMMVTLKDANGDPVLDEDGNEIEFANQWAKSPTSTMDELEVAYLTACEDCVDTSTVSVPGDSTTVSTSSALLDIDFSEYADGDTPEWAEVHAVADEGDWDVSGAMLVQTKKIADGDPDASSPDKPGTLLVGGDVAWTDYALEAGLQASSGAIGIVFRYTDPNNYYRLSVDRDLGYRRLARVLDGNVSAVWEDTSFTDPGDAYPPDTAFLLAVQCEGTRIRGQMDDELLFDEQDEALDAGGVGLYAWNSDSLACSYVLARKWPGAQLAPSTLYSAELQASFVLFNDDILGGWPSWSSPKTGFEVMSEESWEDYRIEVNLMTPASTVGVVARYTSAGHWRLELDGTGAWSMLRQSGGVSTTVASGSGAFVDTSASAAHTLALECVNAAQDGVVQQRISVELDGVALWTEDEWSGWIGSTDLSALEKGSAGLYRAGSDAVFSSFVLRSAPRGTVHRWSFATSAYTNLVEHIDSFAETVYGESVTGDGPDAVDLATADFNDAYGALFADYRPLPPVVELSEVLYNDARYAVLLESPEPFDSTRVSLSLREDLAGTGVYSDVTDLLALWSEDGTRALLLRTGTDGFTDGAYQLQVALALDAGEDPPIWRAGSSSAPEVAALTFTLASA